MQKRAPLLALLLCLAVAGGPIIGLAQPQAADAAPLRTVGREVFGFFTPSERDYMLNVAKYDVLTTVAYFALDARADGTLHKKTSSGADTTAWANWKSSWMDQVIAKAKAHGTRVVLTITRFAWTTADKDITVALLSDAGRRTKLAAEIADTVAARGVHGVNLDFEPIPFEVKDQFTAFVREVRSALNAKKAGMYLTFDGTPTGTNYDIAALLASDAADAVFLMGYSYHTNSSARAGAVSAMGGLTFAVPQSVDRYLAKTSPSKIILGLPYYGREWSTETKYLHSKTRPAGSTYGTPRSRLLDSAIKQGKLHGVRWDSEQLVPWTRWLYRACSSCPQTWRQLYYENRRSLGIKYDFVNRRNLAGVGFWRIGYEGNRPRLYQLLRDKFPPK